MCRRSMLLVVAGRRTEERIKLLTFNNSKSISSKRPRQPGKYLKKQVLDMYLPSQNKTKYIHDCQQPVKLNGLKFLQGLFRYMNFILLFSKVQCWISRVPLHRQSILDVLNLGNKSLYRNMGKYSWQRTKFSLTNRNRAFISRG